MSEGYGIRLVAKIFCVDEDSVYGWINRWKITIHMRVIMIMEIKGSKISNLREYWSSEHIKNKKIIPK